MVGYIYLLSLKWKIVINTVMHFFQWVADSKS